MTLKIHEAGEGDLPSRDDTLGELKSLWPTLTPPLREAVLTLARSVAQKIGRTARSLNEKQPGLLDGLVIEGQLLVPMSTVREIIGGVCESTVYKMLALNELPSPVGVRGRSMWRVADLEAWASELEPARGNRRRVKKSRRPG